MAVTIVSNGSAHATAYTNERKVDRCQNGVLWVMDHDTSDNPQFYFSTDNGVTWTHLTDTWPSHGQEGSIFIDLDDFMHVIVRNGVTTAIEYVRGTPNAGRTSYTWSAVTTVYANINGRYPDIVAHREGTGWVAHVVISSNNGTNSNFAVYFPITITSGGVPAVGTQVNIGGNYNVAVDTFPAIDFNHNGDGKTVASSTPHLYVAWAAGKTGVGFGIRYKKATYSAGVWTWQTEREVNNTLYIPNANNNMWVNAVCNGTDVYIIYLGFDGINYYLQIYKRDIADTTFTLIYNSNALAGTNGAFSGSSSYDTVGNLYIVGESFDVSRINRYKCVLSGSTVTITNVGTFTSSFMHTSLKRGNSNSKIEWVYTDGTVSPFSVKYDSLSAISLSRAFKWNVIAGVLVNRIFKWNVIQTISLNRIFKWNVLSQVSTISRIFKWNVLSQVSTISRIFKWNVLSQVSLSRIFKWNVLSQVSLSRIFKWNVWLAVPTIVRTFLWNVFATWTQIPTQTDLWTSINGNTVAWTPEQVNSTSWR